MIQSGLLLFFLVPGLLTYCALFGAFHSGRSIAPTPPAATSVEAVTLVVLGSAVVHGMTAILIHMNGVICRNLACPVPLPAGLLDPYAAAFDVIGRGAASSDALGGLLVIALAQGIVMYVLVRAWLASRARRDDLPSWIYGWATDIANAADNASDLIFTYVLTNHDHAGQPIVYAGVLYNLGLRADGSIVNVTLYDCERYLADFDGDTANKTLPQPLSRIPFLIVDASQIRNVAFEVISVTLTLDEDGPPAASDPDGTALA